jgi:5-methylthioadenosine/S-adenosylhomocysteine deaminase
MSVDGLLDYLRGEKVVLAPEILLTPDGPATEQALVVDGAAITYAGPLAALPSSDATRARQLRGHAIVPGFVDAHTHLAQTFGKILIGGEPAQIWRRLWLPMEAGLDEEGDYVSAKWQLLEQLRGGFTSVVNYSLGDARRNAAVHRAAVEAGVRLRSSTGLDELPMDAGPDAQPQPLERIFERIQEHIEEVAPYPLISPSVSASSFYGNRPETLAAVSEFARSRGILFQLHANEHFPEVHESILRYGKRPIELLAEHGVLGPHVLIHHATLVTEREVDLLAQSRTAVAYNPVASEWKGNAVAPALSFAAHGVRFGLGSDNTRFDGFRTLDAAEHAQRLVHGLPVSDFSAGAGWTWVDAISRGGADAAGFHDVGSLAAGQAADFLILDMERPETAVSWDFEWELVRYYARDQIAYVVVAGKPVLAAGQPTEWDGPEFVRKYREHGRRIGSLPGIQRVHGSSHRYRAKRGGA